MPPSISSRRLLVTDLAIILLGDDIGFWLPRLRVEPGELGAAVRQVLGDNELIPFGEELREVELLATAEAPFGDSVPVLAVNTRALCAGFAGRPPNAHWSPSVSWLHQVVESAERVVRSARVFPTVRPHGLRWSAVWSLVSDRDLDTQIGWLVDHAPPVVFAGSDRNSHEQVRELLGSVADAYARYELAEAGWRPPLARSRSTSIVALRRIVTALTTTDSVFIGDSPSHELAYAEWSTASSDAANRLAGGPAVGFRGRLVSPELDDDSGIWLLLFEIVGADGRVVSFRDVWEGSEAAWSVVDREAIASLQTRMLELLDRLTGQLAVFEPLIGRMQPTEIAFGIDEVGELLDGSLIAARRAGLPIVTPSNLRRTTARLTARARSSDELPGHRSSAGLISVDWGVALGDLDLSSAELQALADSKAEIVALRGAWIQIDQEQISDVVAAQQKRQLHSSELSAAELLRESIAAFDHPRDDMSAEGWVAALLDGLPDDQLREAVESPGFDGTLRHYQRRALAWLQFLGRLGLGGCLADDMGLGKTPTTLAHLLDRSLAMTDGDSEHRPHLVVCPLSVVSNWAAEAARFTPDLSVLVAHGPNRAQGADLVRVVKKHDIVITTYGTAPRVADELAPIDWDVVVFDEAQAIKNHTTITARSVRELRANQRIALTGTPIENRLSELWSILDALNPGMLGGITWFRSNLATPIETNGDTDKIEALKSLTAPFVLRRTKADRSLVPDLPDKVEQIAWATLTTEQAALYQAVVDDFLAQLDQAAGMERRGLVLSTLTRLKQVCNHPAQFLRETDVGEGRSGKLDRFDELVDSIIDANDRALVFTQYRQMGLLLATHVRDRYGIDAPFLHGGTARSQRDRMVDEFQHGSGPPIQLISLRAGGTGLNLTAASRVIHYDRWWNPAVEDQATDRTWRIGQTQTVFVNKLVCQGTLEDRIDALLTRKRALADAIVSSGDQWLTELSTDELRTLVRLDPDLTVVR